MSGLSTLSTSSTFGLSSEVDMAGVLVGCTAGCDLNSDLAQLKAEHGQDHLVMEATFPSDYPASPFFLRMVTPRCVWCALCSAARCHSAFSPVGRLVQRTLDSRDHRFTWSFLFTSWLEAPSIGASFDCQLLRCVALPSTLLWSMQAS